MKANELAGIGIGVAALIGVAGYLVVRRRNTV
jgi:LPXTG-motif cell wall-anchored protein